MRGPGPRGPRNGGKSEDPKKSLGKVLRYVMGDRGGWDYHIGTCYFDDDLIYADLDRSVYHANDGADRS